MGRIRGVLWGIVLLALVIVVASCGGDSDTGETTGKNNVFFPRIKGPSREFLIRGGDNIVQSFGEEGTAAERAQASRVIHAWMRARAAEDWAQDCKYFSKLYANTLTNDAKRVTNGKVTTCTEALDFFGKTASGDLVNTLTGPIDSLRVRGHNGFAQWHGIKKTDWVLPMREEGGVWLVDIAAPIDRNA
jgi:hypothetical protein